ncbi:MAG: MoaD/ThiS family protein [Nanoarchaeota archaeon]|nr:MoaD/ThiS family protein [Nanoarchaeota archaeon]
MKVYIDRDGKYAEAKGKTIGCLLKYLKINPQTVIITKNEKLAIEETKVKADDKIIIYHFVSGG